jgi:hypothetical protein
MIEKTPGFQDHRAELEAHELFQSLAVAVLHVLHALHVLPVPAFRRPSLQTESSEPG